MKRSKSRSLAVMGSKAGGATLTAGPSSATASLRAAAYAALAPVRAIAAPAVAMHDALVAELVQAVRNAGVSEAKVQKALRAYERAQDVQSLIALALPIVPNPRLIRAVSGIERPSTETKTRKKDR